MRSCRIRIKMYNDILISALSFLVAVRTSTACKAPNSVSHLQLKVLLLEVFIFVWVAVGELVDLDTILLDLLSDLQRRKFYFTLINRFHLWEETIDQHTVYWLALIFFFLTSIGVSVSALARMGTMLTFSCRAFMNSTSKGRRLGETWHIHAHEVQPDTRPLK